MYRLLGPHINRLNGSVVTLRKWKPPLAVVLNPGPEWVGLASELETLLIGRFFFEHQPDFNTPLSGKQEAEKFHHQFMRHAARCRPAFDYWIGVNEPVILSLEAMKRFAEFEIRRTELLASEGMKAALASFAVGNPSQLAWWEAFVPALEFGRNQKAILSLHQYWWDDPKEPWTALRHRFVYHGERTTGWKGLPAHLRLPLAITECGRDYGVKAPGVVRGWRGQVSQAQYLAELEAFSAALLQDAYVLGAAIFCLHSESALWTGYDIAPDIVQTLTEQAKPLYRPPVTLPPPTPPPPPAYIDLVGQLPVHPTRKYRTRTEAKRIVIHHSGVDHRYGDIRSVQLIASYHVQQLGWPGIGYHYIIDYQGKLYRTQPEEVIAFHAAGANEDSIGLCILGNFTTKDPKPAQLQTAVNFIRQKKLPILGHKEVGRTACPGTNTMSLIRRMLNENL